MLTETLLDKQEQFALTRDGLSRNHPDDLFDGSNKYILVNQVI